ncbi:MAG: chromosomal replication initiator protein DnaA [Patescibacteria group bacterium]|nr:chromosomal replication initiator protein DnaA [Patescibacteria group bacterium]MDD5715977.1 chromosomal replication initiator protein DnaA [Patescibacteria group bacterium]
MDKEQLWHAALGELELTLSKANFTTWFKNTFVSSYENESVIIGVPNAFTKTWLENKYHKQILEALKHATDNHITDVQYRVEVFHKGAAHHATAPAAPAQQRPEQVAPVTQKNGYGLNARYTFSTFVVGKGNELAHAACLAVAQRPGVVYNPLFLYGGAGLGKTHLLQAIAHEIATLHAGKKILYVTCEKFTNEFIAAISQGGGERFKNVYRTADVLLIDDIQFLAGKEGTQEEFFHTFNALHQQNKQIVLSSDRPPKAIPALENRLISRFEWGMIADIAQPDYETRIAILSAKCKEKNLSFPREILSTVATSVQSNVRELEGALNRILAFHQLNNSKPSVESVRGILASMSQHQKREGAITIKQIINTVAAFFDISVADLTGSSRKKELVVPRQITMFLMREEAKCSYPSIGQELGGRDHTTAMHAYEKIRRAFEEDEKIHQDINLIRQRLYNE